MPKMESKWPSVLPPFNLKLPGVEELVRCVAAAAATDDTDDGGSGSALECVFSRTWKDTVHIRFISRRTLRLNTACSY